MTAREKLEQLLEEKAEQMAVERLAELDWHKRPCTECDGKGWISVAEKGRRICWNCTADGYNWVKEEEKEVKIGT